MAGGYNPEHYQPLFQAEERHFWFRARNTVLETLVRRETAALPGGYRVLEVGCGTGYVLRMLQRVCDRGTVIGMDLFLEGLQLAKRRGGARLVQARIEHPPFSQPFDLVGIFDTLEHIENDRAVLRHLRYLVRGGGALLLTVPAYQALWSDFDEDAHHCRRYEPAQLFDRLSAAGFTVDYLTPFMATLYPLARLGRQVADARRVRRVRSGREATSAVHEQLRIMPGNGLLCWILEQEARLLARRKHLPIGTSLIAVARVP